MLAVMEDGDVLSAHLQPHSQLLVADTKTPKVGVGVAIRSKCLLANKLSIYHKACGTMRDLFAITCHIADKRLPSFPEQMVQSQG